MPTFPAGYRTLEQSRDDPQDDLEEAWRDSQVREEADKIERRFNNQKTFLREIALELARRQLSNKSDE